ncbi:MAG: NAD(P)H-dependent oxidoreductase [Lachnospiraceae bacterium]|nr:NAD(P)H-dependent oxidoreductase [Lachnospiraceae bacterium]
MILYINSCVRDESRTNRIAQALLQKLGEEYEEIKLYEEKLYPLSKAALKHRTELIENENYSSPIFKYAKQFAAADTIVIAAPFWDLSFPADLKTYIENIYVTGIVSRYGIDGKPVGMCKAEQLYYVTTAGGPYLPDYSFGYIRDLAVQHFGIKEIFLIKAEMLDVEGFSAENIIRQVIDSI